MSDPEVFIGLDVGKAEHHCVALNLAGDRLVDRPLPNDEAALRGLFAQLAAEDHLTGIGEPTAFATRAAHYIAELNAIHPFREGNGRCQLTLLSILMELAGLPMDEDRIEPEGFMQAMVASFGGALGPLTAAIAGMAEG